MEESRKGLSERAKRIYCKRCRGGEEWEVSTTLLGGGSSAIAQLGGPQEEESAVMEGRGWVFLTDSEAQAPP